MENRDNTTRTTTRTSRSTTRTSTSTSNRTKAAVELYMYCIGGQPTPFVVSQIEEAIDNTCIEVVTYAMEEAAAAPRPSWRYAQAIIRNCEGITHVNRHDGLTNRQAIDVARSLNRDRQQYAAMRNDSETELPY